MFDQLDSFIIRYDELSELLRPGSYRRYKNVSWN